MTDEDLKKLVESNARSIQALTDNINSFADRMSQLMEQAQAERQELRQAMIQSQAEQQELRQATIGIANLLAALDQDRPTILKRLTSIENKIDQILEKNQFGNNE